MAIKKRMTLVFILCFFCITTFANAQPSNRGRSSTPPNLLSESQFRTFVSQANDVDSLLEIYTRYSLQQLRRSPENLKNLITEIQGLNDIPELKKSAYSNFIMGYYWDRPKPDSAIFFFKKAEDLFINLRNYDKVVNAMTMQARSYSRINEYLIAEDKYYEVLSIIEKYNLEDRYEEVTINELSDLYMRVGAVDIALDKYKQLLEIGSSSYIEECRIRLKISNAFKRNRELDLAKEQLVYCIDKIEEDIPLYLVFLRSLSDLEKTLGNSKERLALAEKAVEISDKEGIRDFLTYYFLLEANFENGRYSKADSIITILDSFNGIRIQLPVRINYLIFKAKFSLEIEEYNNAIRFADQAIKDLERLRNSPLLLDASTIKAQALEKLGDYKSAYEITKTLVDTEKTITEMGRIRQEELTKVRLQMRSKNREIEDISNQLGTLKVRNALVILFLLLTAFYLLYRFRINALLKEERTRNRIAQDLHDDLSGTLSSISFFSEAAKRGKDLNDSGKFLERIDESAFEAKEKINDIIWSIDPENDDWMSFLAKCRRYASEVFESRNIEYEINFDKDFSVNLNLETKQDLWLIFKEMVNNLGRHSGATYSKISIKKEGKHFCLKVSDNGKGFSDKEIGSGNGVKNIKYRAERLGAVVKLESKASEGTLWELRLPT